MRCLDSANPTGSRLSRIQSLAVGTVQAMRKGDIPMATFISTIKFTAQGIKAIGETTKRAASLKAAAKKMGVKVTNIFWTLGPFDGLLVFEASDDETATALMLHLSSLGNLQTTTARAFTAAEMDGILAKMSG